MEIQSEVTRDAVQLAQDINTRISSFMMHYGADGAHMGHDILTEWSPEMTRDTWFVEENIVLSHPGRADASTYMTPREAQDRIDAFKSTGDLVGPDIVERLNDLARRRGFASYQENVIELGNGYVPPSYKETIGFNMTTPDGEMVDQVTSSRTVDFPVKPLVSNRLGQKSDEAFQSPFVNVNTKAAVARTPQRPTL